VQIPVQIDRQVEATMAKATVSYSEETKTVEIVVPRGTKGADIGRIVERARTTLFPNPRLCSTCFSGRVYNIREAAPEVAEVDLDK
jgi:hypothetical protein